MEYGQPRRTYLDETEASGYISEQLKQDYLGSESKDSGVETLFTSKSPKHWEPAVKMPWTLETSSCVSDQDSKADTPTVGHEGANLFQHGGNHYKTKIEPWDAIADWGLTFLDGNAVKYIARWKKKNGVEDLKKAIHYLQKQIETVEGKK